MERTDQRTTQPSPAAHQLLAEPSYAAQILRAAADTMANNNSVEPVNAWDLDRALTDAEHEILGGLPDAVCVDAAARARNSLPLFQGITRGEYALRLRRAAA